MLGLSIYLKKENLKEIRLIIALIYPVRILISKMECSLRILLDLEENKVHSLIFIKKIYII